MSGKLVTYVSQFKLGSPTRKSIIVALAETANSDGCAIWKSHKTLAAQVEVSTKTIQRTLKDFEAEGLLCHVGWKVTGGAQTKHYEMDLDVISELPVTKVDDGFKPLERVDNLSTVDTDDPTGGLSETKGWTSDVQQPVLTRPNPSFTPNAGVNRDFVRAVQARWNTMASLHEGMPRVEMILGPRAGWIAKRLADVDGDQSAIMRAIDNVPNDPHRMGNTQGGWRADFDWVFKDSQNFLKCLESQPQPKAQHERTNPNRKPSARETSDVWDRATQAAILDVQSGRAS